MLQGNVTRLEAQVRCWAFRIRIVAAMVLPSRQASAVFPRRVGVAAWSTAAPHGAMLSVYVPDNCIGPPSVASLTLLRPHPPLHLRFVYGLARRHGGPGFGFAACCKLPAVLFTR